MLSRELDESQLTLKALCARHGERIHDKRHEVEGLFDIRPCAMGDSTSILEVVAEVWIEGHICVLAILTHSNGVKYSDSIGASATFLTKMSETTTCQRQHSSDVLL